MNQYEKTKQAFDEIISVIDKHKKIIPFDLDIIADACEGTLRAIELKEKYGFNIKEGTIIRNDYHKFGEYMAVGNWGSKFNRTISWEDNGDKAQNEILLSLCFSSGAYIFEAGYPHQIFNDFFSELKSYNPKYIDTRNNNLFFQLENASKIFNDFRGIFEKYKKIAKKWEIEEKIHELKEKLEKSTKEK